MFPLQLDKYLKQTDLQGGDDIFLVCSQEGKFHLHINYL
jgi:hypothetical protein